jgi:hypothetical protein
VPEGVLDFRAGLPGVAIYLVTSAFGLQAAAAGRRAGNLLDTAF